MMRKVEFTIRNQYHLLRHFRQIDQNYREKIKNHTDYSDHNINDQLAMSGSKFYPTFTKNPEHLWEKISNHKNFCIPGINDWTNNVFVISLLYEQNQYPEGVGDNSLVRLDTLKPAELKQVWIQKRDGIPLNHYKSEHRYPSWQVNVVLGKGQGLFIRTLFPGTYAPPFPDPKQQNEAELRENKAFWNQHALISKGFYTK